MVKELECPICNADVPIHGDEKPGDEVFCTYCRAPLTFKGTSEEDYDLEEDF